MKQFLAILLIVLITSSVTAQNSEKIQSVDFPLKYGQRNNLKVYMIQSILLPREEQSGNFDNSTKRAVAEYILKNRLNYLQDGSEVSLQLFQTIVASKGSIKQNTNNNTFVSGQPQQTIDYTNVTFPIMLGDGDPNKGFSARIWGDVIGRLQLRLKIPQTGIVDGTTIEAIRKFINDPVKKKFIVSSPDEDDLALLENITKPGITVDMYNLVMDTTGLILMHNQRAKQADRIN